MQELYLKPLDSVGPFKFNSSIEAYLDSYELKYSPDIDETEWKTYSIEEMGLNIYVEQEKRVSIKSMKHLFYGDKDLIGMDFDFFKEYFQIEPDEEDSISIDDDMNQSVYEFEKLGLQVWVRYHKIVTVFCSRD